MLRPSAIEQHNLTVNIISRLISLYVPVLVKIIYWYPTVHIPAPKTYQPNGSTKFSSQMVKTQWVLDIEYQYWSKGDGDDSEAVKATPY